MTLSPRTRYGHRQILLVLLISSVFLYSARRHQLKLTLSIVTAHVSHSNLLYVLLDVVDQRSVLASVFLHPSLMWCRPRAQAGMVEKAPITQPT